MERSQIDNGHLAGPGPHGPRVWDGWFHPKFPLAWLEPDLVVDGPSERDIRIDLPRGGSRTWRLRARTPTDSKQTQLHGHYSALETSILQHGVLTPVLLWRSPASKFYLRYGQSRVLVAARLGLNTIPAVICDYSAPPGVPARPLVTPLEVLSAFGPPASVGWLEVSHERIDAHHIEPNYPK